MKQGRTKVQCRPWKRDHLKKFGKGLSSNNHSFRGHSLVFRGVLGKNYRLNWLRWISEASTLLGTSTTCLLKKIWLKLDQFPPKVFGKFRKILAQSPPRTVSFIIHQTIMRVPPSPQCRPQRNQASFRDKLTAMIPKNNPSCFLGGLALKGPGALGFPWSKKVRHETNS